MPNLDNQIVEEANKLVDVPYRDKGRDRISGVDCIGLVILIGHTLGISDYDTRNYSKRPVFADFMREMKGQLKEVPIKDLGHGHVAVCREERHPCHCGIIEVDATGQMWFIHAYAPAKKVQRERMTEDRKGRIIRVFRYPEAA